MNSVLSEWSVERLINQEDRAPNPAYLLLSVSVVSPFTGINPALNFNARGQNELAENVLMSFFSETALMVMAVLPANLTGRSMR